MQSVRESVKMARELNEERLKCFMKDWKCLRAYDNAMKSVVIPKSCEQNMKDKKWAHLVGVEASMLHNAIYHCGSAAINFEESGTITNTNSKRKVSWEDFQDLVQEGNASYIYPEIILPKNFHDYSLYVLSLNQGHELYDHIVSCAPIKTFNEKDVKIGKMASNDPTNHVFVFRACEECFMYFDEIINGIARICINPLTDPILVKKMANVARHFNPISPLANALRHHFDPDEKSLDFGLCCSSNKKWFEAYLKTFQDVKDINLLTKALGL
jgi:hypothetical protein